MGSNLTGTDSFFQKLIAIAKGAKKVNDKTASPESVPVQPMAPPTATTLLGRVAQSVGNLTRKSEVLSSIIGLATYFRFSFR